MPIDAFKKIELKYLDAQLDSNPKCVLPFSEVL